MMCPACLRAAGGAQVELVREVLVAPVLARMSSGSPEGPDPEKTSRQLVDLIYDGIRPAP